MKDMPLLFLPQHITKSFYQSFAYMTINVKFRIEETVYLKTDPDQYPRIVLGYVVYTNTIKYILGQSVDESMHLDIEISKDKNLLI